LRNFFICLALIPKGMDYFTGLFFQYGRYQRKYHSNIKGKILRQQSVFWFAQMALLSMLLI